MEAMILAAGLGTRLRPLTDDRPKALVEVGGAPLLAHTARRLVAAGVDHLVINVHHFADRIQAFIEANDGFGVEVSLSHEAQEALGTGGGVKRAGPLFRKQAPFFVHNVDVLTDLDLRALYDAHLASGALATLAVQAADTHRVLLFDQKNRLCGYGRREDGALVTVRPPEGPLQKMDFLGVQVVSPRIFDLMPDEDVFSIVNAYMRLIQKGERVDAFRADEARWIDVGTPERLAKARQMDAWQNA